MEFPLWLSGLLTRLVSMRMLGQSLALLRGLRIQRCFGCVVGCRSNSTPTLGTSIRDRCGPKKKKKISVLLFVLLIENTIYVKCFNHHTFSNHWHFSYFSFWTKDKVNTYVYMCYLYLYITILCIDMYIYIYAYTYQHTQQSVI